MNLNNKIKKIILTSKVPPEQNGKIDFYVQWSEV